MSCLLFVDDHAVVRATIGEVVAASMGAHLLQAASPEEGIKILETAESPVSVALLDLEFAGRDGPHPVRLFRSRFPKIPIVVLTAHEDLHSQREAQLAGATGFIGKSASTVQVIAAVNLAMTGLTFTSFKPEDLCHETTDPKLAPGDPDHELARLLAAGLADKHLAARLGITVGALRHRLTALYRRLGVRRRAEAIALIIKLRR